MSRGLFRWLRLELRLILASRAVPAGMILLLGAGLVALAHGRAVVARQQAALEASPSIQADEHRRVLAPLPPTANAGDQLYYLFFHTVREPSPWAPVALGQRDVQAWNLKVRMLALQGQIYDTDLGNPLLASLGHFDLAFVIVVLAPLLLVAFTYNVYSGEVEAGTWSLLHAQPVHVGRVLLVKYVLRAAMVWLPVAALLVAAVVWPGVPMDAAWWTVLAAATAYLGVWAVASMAVAAGRWSSDVNVLVLLGVWVAWTALGPALVNAAAAARYPLPEALELTVLQRQGYHEAWDRPLDEVMEAFYTRYPEWRGAPIPRDRYSNGWYYAMQQRGDDAAREAGKRYREQLLAREAWVARLSWLLPPAALDRQLSRVARTDLEAYLAYLDSVADYHESLKRHFFPVVFSDRTVGEVDWDSAPRHRHRD